MMNQSFWEKELAEYGVIFMYLSVSPIVEPGWNMRVDELSSLLLVIDAALISINIL